MPGPRLNRPAGHPRVNRPAGHNRASVPFAAMPRLVTDDAVAYVMAVKEMFTDDKDKYSKFLEVLTDYRDGRIGTAGVVTRVRILFRGHRTLILAFNAFLPKGFEITLPAKEERLTKKQPTVEMEQAISYVPKRRARLQDLSGDPQHVPRRQ